LSFLSDNSNFNDFSNFPFLEKSNLYYCHGYPLSDKKWAKNKDQLKKNDFVERNYLYLSLIALLHQNNSNNSFECSEYLSHHEVWIEETSMSDSEKV